MAQTFVYNTNELSPQGYLKPANTVSAVSPDNVTHLQLRYSDFSSSYVIQGSVVSGANSTFEFSIADNLASEIFKMYYSTDGTTYTVDKTFGGTSGKKLFATADLSGLVTLTTAQTISAVKTFSALPESAVTPTTAGQFTRKAYVDARASKEALIFVSSYDPVGGTIVSQVLSNTTGRTFTLSNVSGGINIAFTGGSTTSLFFMTFNAIDDFDANVGFSYQSGFDQSSPYTSLLAFFDSAAFSGSVMKNFPILIKDYS